jgi:putative transposase
MTYIGMNKNRKHIRLSDWDYSSPGIYFITICCSDRQPFFGRIINNRINHSEIGLIASQFWLEIPEHFTNVKLDEFVVMPNHIHGILILNNSSERTRHGIAGTRHGVSLQTPIDDNVGSCHDMTHPSKQLKPEINQFANPVRNSVSVIIGQYKSSVKRWCNKNGFDDFQWQSRFYDRILHNENSIDRVREYIHNNPNNWIEDEFYN